MILSRRSLLTTTHRHGRPSAFVEVLALHRPGSDCFFVCPRADAGPGSQFLLKAWRHAGSWQMKVAFFLKTWRRLSSTGRASTCDAYCSRRPTWLGALRTGRWRPGIDSISLDPSTGPSRRPRRPHADRRETDTFFAARVIVDSYFIGPSRGDRRVGKTSAPVDAERRPDDSSSPLLRIVLLPAADFRLPHDPFSGELFWKKAGKPLPVADGRDDARRAPVRRLPAAILRHAGRLCGQGAAPGGEASAPDFAALPPTLLFSTAQTSCCCGRARLQDGSANKRERRGQADGQRQGLIANWRARRPQRVVAASASSVS